MSDATIPTVRSPTAARDAPRDPVTTVRRALPWILVAAVVAALVGYGTAVLLPVRYEATATLLLVGPERVDSATDPAVAAVRYPAPPLEVATYLQIARSDTLLARAFADELPGEAPPTVAERFAPDVRVRSADDGGSALLFVTVRAADPHLAAARAQSLADALVAWDEARAMRAVQEARAAAEAQIERLQAALNGVSFQQARALGTVTDQRREQLARLMALELSPVSPLTPVHAAEAPVAPAGRSPIETAILAAGLTIVAALGAVLAVNAIRTT